MKVSICSEQQFFCVLFLIENNINYETNLKELVFLCALRQ